MRKCIVCYDNRRKNEKLAVNNDKKIIPPYSPILRQEDVGYDTMEFHSKYKKRMKYKIRRDYKRERRINC